MATAIKPKPKTKTATGGEGRDLPLRLIDRSPFQPRLIFDERELRELAATIAAAGVLQPIIVRPKGNRYELICGERRLRAAKIAKLEKIPAIVRKLDDAQSREVAAIENLQRKDLNPIEQARAYQQLLKGGTDQCRMQNAECRMKKVTPSAPHPVSPSPRHPVTQIELARRLGVSQPQIANRLRLLGLPAAWQERIISGEITASQARCLLPYKGQPKVLAAIEKDVNAALKRSAELTTEDFEDLVADGANTHTRRMDGEDISWDSRLGGRTTIFRPSEEQEANLEIIEVADCSGKPVRRACNVKLWEKLQAAHVDKLVQQKAEKAEGKRGKTKEGEPKKVSAAERKRLEQQNRKRAGERARLYAVRLWEWKLDWLRYLIHAAIADGLEPQNLLRLLLYFSAAPQQSGDAYRRAHVLQTYLRSRSIRLFGRAGLPDLWKGISQLQNAELVDEAARCFAAGMFYEPNAAYGPAASVPEQDVAAIADFLCIDVQKVWKQQQGGPLSESYWNLHSKQQLVELAKELKLKLDGSVSKDQILKTFLECKKPLPLPKEIAKARRPK